MGSSKLFLPLLVVAIAFLVNTFHPELLSDLLNGDSSGIAVMSSENSIDIDGMPFPSQLKIAGAKQSLVGGGTRSKWGFKVYAVGIYSDVKVVKTLKKKYGSNTAAVTVNKSMSKDFSESKQARSLLLRFFREVAAADVAEALGEALIDKVGKETSSAFSKFVLDMVGGEKLAKGSDLYITCKGEKLWASLTGGADADTISMKGLCPAIFQVYIGEKPVSPQAKEGFEKGFGEMTV